MLTDSQMNTSNSSSHLSLIHPDDTEHPNTPISNMPFDESIEFRNSDYISSDIMELSDEMKESEESKNLGNEDFDVYNKVFDCLPPIPPTKEEEHVFPAPIIVPESDKDRIDINMLKQLTGNDKFYARKFNEVKDKIGDGKMEYIKNQTQEKCLRMLGKRLHFRTIGILCRKMWRALCGQMTQESTKFQKKWSNLGIMVIRELHLVIH